MDRHEDAMIAFLRKGQPLGGQGACGGRGGSSRSRRAGGRHAGPFGGRLTPLPLGDGEVLFLRGLAAAMRDASAGEALEARYRFLRNAMGLGFGTDRDVIEGLDHVLAGLSLLREADRRRRASGTDPDDRGRREDAPGEEAASALEASLLRYEEVRRRSGFASPRD